MKRCYIFYVHRNGVTVHSTGTGTGTPVPYIQDAKQTSGMGSVVLRGAYVRTVRRTSNRIKVIRIDEFEIDAMYGASHKNLIFPTRGAAARSGRANAQDWYSRTLQYSTVR